MVPHVSSVLPRMADTKSRMASSPGGGATWVVAGAPAAAEECQRVDAEQCRNHDDRDQPEATAQREGPCACRPCRPATPILDVRAPPHVLPTHDVSRAGCFSYAVTGPISHLQAKPAGRFDCSARTASRVPCLPLRDRHDGAEADVRGAAVASIRASRAHSIPAAVAIVAEVGTAAKRPQRSRGGVGAGRVARVPADRATAAYAAGSNASAVHCQTFPDMSYRPEALGGWRPTGAVVASCVGNAPE